MCYKAEKVTVLKEKTLMADLQLGLCSTLLHWK